MDVLWVLQVLLVILIFLFTFLRFKAYQTQQYFESRGIYYPGDGLLRTFKNFLRGIISRDALLQQYNQMKVNGKNVAGTRDFGKTAIMVTDLNLLKQILIKDFENFTDRQQFSVPESDWLFRKMLIANTGDRWKALRSKMSPTFTTGKIRRMFRIFDDSSKKLMKYVKQQMDQSGQIDLEESFSKFTLDVIASAAFGIDSKAFDQIEPSIFEQMGLKAQIKFGGIQTIRVITTILFPKLANYLGLSFFPKDVQHFFTGVIKSALKHRKETGEIREDFIQLMLEARQGHLKTKESELDKFEKDAILKEGSKALKVNTADLLDDQGIVANCVLFFLGGYSNIQSLLLFASYSLAMNKEVQDKLRSEIDSALEKKDGEFNYESIHKMEYLDMVINETLRYYPPAQVTDRGCTQDYKIPDTDFILKKSHTVVVPIIGIHHDEKYYPEPEKFLPERFSVENKLKMNPYAFMPFGHGPRNCIGMRFAVTEVKLAVAHLVHNFTIEPSEKTLIPMQYKNTSTLKPVGGMWLAFHCRQ